MDPLIYKVLHLLGAFMVFLAYGALIARSALAADDRRFRRLGAITSGVGLLLLLLGGFGMQARYGYKFEPWIWGKIVLWVLLGVLIVFINRRPHLSMALWWVTLLIGLIAAYLGLFGKVHLVS